MQYYWKKGKYWIVPIIEYPLHGFLLYLQQFKKKNLNRSHLYHMLSSIKKQRKKWEILARSTMKNKPISWGFKLWRVCESKTRYLYGVDIYTGANVFVEIGLDESVVLQMPKKGIAVLRQLYYNHQFSVHFAKIKCHHGLRYVRFEATERTCLRIKT